MIVFSTYLKIIKRNFISIFMMFVIFIIVSYFFVNFTDNQNSLESFNTSTTNVAIISKSTDEKDKGLEKYLNENFQIVDVENDDRAIKDALFYGAVEYVLVIDNGEYKDYRVPDSQGGILVNSYVNSYLNTYNNFENSKTYSNTELVNKTLTNLNEKVNVKYLDNETVNKAANKAKTFYNLFAYSIIATLTTGIGTVNLALGRREVLKRTIVSKLSISQRNLQLFLGHICFSIIIWIAANIVGGIILDIDLFTKQHLLFIFNSFFFVIAISSLSFLLSTFIKDYRALSAMSNIVSLGLSFTSGIFITQAVLSPFVLKIASFMPAYWYVIANEDIASIDNIGLSELLQPTLMMVLFTLVFIALSMVVSKQKKNY